MNKDISGILRNFPSVSDFLNTEHGIGLAREFGEGMLKLELRSLLEEIREAVRAVRKNAVPDSGELAVELRARLTRAVQPLGQRAINATGILLHTNLGRAPLSAKALEAVENARHYSILEMDVESGKRSHRDTHIEPLLRELTGCEAATVVNNNAAATLIILNTLFEGREVLISRGQLVEIGGAFRMPDVMQKSGAVMREVGTTNRTHLKDYEKAVNDKTGGMIHVHCSNYRIRGFAGTPDIRELCELGRRSKLPVVDDLGSGALVPLSRYGLPDEPLAQDSIKAGADVVCFSGDKLIGGPQTGIICGTKESIRKIRQNPFARMFRVDKMTLAALRATLLHWVNGQWERIPFYQMLSLSLEELQTCAEGIVHAVGQLPGVRLTVQEDWAYVGSGSAPDEGIPGKVIRLEFLAGAKPELTAEAAARRLRQSLPSVFCRIKDNALLFDMRTLQPEEPDHLASLLRKLFS